MHIKQNVSTTRQVPNIGPGWVNKAKGAFQVLYERGWIDPNQIKKSYTWQGPMDNFGNHDIKYSIKHLIKSQLDFLEQKTLLQHYCELLNEPISKPKVVQDATL